MVESFFSISGAKLSHRPSHPITLLSGPPSCGKTSLLFQFAFNAALADGSRKVVFICNRNRIEKNPPLLSLGIDPSCDTFHRIQMKYVDDEEGVMKYFAAFHLYDTFPVAVVIDDFGDLFNYRNCQQRYRNARGRDLAMVRSLALCHNAIMHANQKGSCNVVLSETHHGDSSMLLFIYKRWVHSIFIIKGDGKGSFFLRSNGNVRDSNPERMRTARYSISLQYLFLDGINENEEIEQDFLGSSEFN